MDEQCYCIVHNKSSASCTHCRSQCKVLESDDSYRCWFRDQLASSAGPAENDKGTQIKLDNDQSPDESPLLVKKPETDDLMKLFIDSAAHYMIIGIGLSVNVTDLTPLPHLTILNLIQVFQRWSDSNNDVTWAKILKVCQDFPNQLGKAEADINKFLLSPEARDKYLK
ncbi:PREDICTED: uncharacterized protein LOC109591929 [Amphimedon queenslandica]|uniref:Death domain-containing protein n=2 Tax=Amphimedon queenslandica TaxID=400682 RepID=A0AAN0K1E8_AMPQE|nr:PREDICTED: uncharacterized protein LOC109591929 [Amphimedon queenslandica]|eukprot:XP_019863087.1 PREDICTED: uncharacterized protein LOC109591929 [Amphimedon queenslandica]